MSKASAFYVEWDDSASVHGWEHDRNIKFKPAKCSTLGFLVNENKSTITLAGTVEAGAATSCGAMTIPKSAITKRRKVKI